MSGQPGAAGQQYGGFGSQNPVGGQPFNYMQNQQQAMQRGAGMAPQTGFAQRTQASQPGWGGGFMTPGTITGTGTGQVMTGGGIPQQTGGLPQGWGPVPTGTYQPDGSYGGINGAQTPQAMVDMQQNHPVLYALRQKLMQQQAMQGQAGPQIGGMQPTGLLGG